MRLLKTLYILGILYVATACTDAAEDPVPMRSMEVTASAYNSLSWQTQGDPALTAFGDTLKPGMKALAVSRDLLDSGLTHNTKVYIPELRDTFLVKDKMNRRYVRKVDIYMGTNVDSAREWGMQKLTISWKAKDTATQRD